jgi:hypothetical protein
VVHREFVTLDTGGCLKKYYYFSLQFGQTANNILPHKVIAPMSIGLTDLDIDEVITYQWDIAYHRKNTK